MRKKKKKEKEEEKKSMRKMQEGDFFVFERKNEVGTMGMRR